MGNPFACVRAVVHFALVEHLILEIKYRNNVLVLVRFIDDMFVVWKRLRCNLIIWRISKDVLIKHLIKLGL